jgi:hypothetical protein
LEPGGFKLPAGVDQVVFQIPEGIEGCYVPVGVVPGTDTFSTKKIHNEGVLSNHATISISSSGGICSDPTGLRGEELDLLQKNEKSNIGVVSLSRAFYLDNSLTAKEVAEAAFRRYDAAGLLASHGIFGLPAVGTCLWLPEIPPEVLPKDGVQPPKTDAGAILTLTGPKGTQQLARDESGQYRTVIVKNSPRTEPAWLAPGSYTLDNGEGGADVGPFRVEFTVPAPITWMNRKAWLQEPPLYFTWTGGDPGTYVAISLLAANDYAGSQLLCVAENSAGRLAAPSILLRGMVGTMVGGTFGNQPYLLGIGSLSVPARFSAPNLDTGLVISVILTDAVYYNVVMN